MGWVRTSRVALPAGVTLANGTESASGTLGNWRVPPGSTMRLQQLLANLGYLPLHFESSGPSVPLTATAQEGAAVAPSGRALLLVVRERAVGAAQPVGAGCERRDDPRRGDGV